MKYDELDDSRHICGKNKSGISGELLDVSINDNCISEVKTDIIVKEFQSVRIWGQIKDCNNCPVSNVLLKLLRCNCENFSGIAHTVSDCHGFYQFDLCGKHVQGAYKIIASKPTCNTKKVLNAPYSNCENCNNCLENHQDTLATNGFDYCQSKPKGHCKKSALCKTCAYYDEITGACHLEN